MSKIRNVYNKIVTSNNHRVHKWINILWKQSQYWGFAYIGCYWGQNLNANWQRNWIRTRLKYKRRRKTGGI